MVYIVNTLVFLMGILKYFGVITIDLKDKYGYEISGLELISISVFVAIFLLVIKLIDIKNIHKNNGK